MSQNFNSPRLLIKRARGHIEEFANSMKKFSNEKPYKHSNSVDPNTGETIFKVKLISPLPDMLPAIIKDCLGNLRDALDHAVYGSAIDLGIENPEKTAFPFGGSREDVERDLNKKYKDIPVPMKQFLLSLQPYPGGNDLLLALNSLRNPTIHRIVVPIGMAHSSTISITSGFINSGSLGYSRWHQQTNEIEYARLGSGSKINHQVSFTFDAIFGNVEGLSGKPVGRTLDEMVVEVERTVDAIADETARLSAI